MRQVGGKGGRRTYTESCTMQRMEREPTWTPGEVAALRRRLGLTQAGMARLLGVRQQTISEWETGLHRPRGASARLLRLLAEERVPYDADGGGPGSEAP
ncbi:MAG: hypothetical protein KatS3mg062_1162 [Tepidiforma sp.]|nr:MAG: hypothetical protein KatS3mg062_1162 [Tepidiforma sp.]